MPSALHCAQGISLCESPFASAWVTPPDECTLPLGDPGSFVPCKGPVPSPTALGSHSHDGVRSGPSHMGFAPASKAFIRSRGKEKKQGGGAVWFQRGGQCNVCLPSLLGKRLPTTLGQALVGLEVPPWGPAHGTSVVPPHTNIYIRTLCSLLYPIPVLPPGSTVPPAGKSTSCSGLLSCRKLVPVVLSRLCPGMLVCGWAPVSVAQGSCFVFWGINS